MGGGGGGGGERYGSDLISILTIVLLSLNTLAIKNILHPKILLISQVVIHQILFARATGLNTSRDVAKNWGIFNKHPPKCSGEVNIHHIH